MTCFGLAAAAASSRSSSCVSTDIVAADRMVATLVSGVSSCRDLSASFVVDLCVLLVGLP